MNIELLTTFFLKTSKNLQDTPVFAERKSERRQEIRYISLGTQSILTLRILPISVGEVENLSGAFDGLVGLGKKKSKSCEKREH